MGGIALIGGAAAVLGAMGGAGGGASAATPDSTSHKPMPTIPTYNMVGGDVDMIKLAGITTSTKYSQNQLAYDDIRVGYSLARGYTGVGTNIAVLDAAGRHGQYVMEIAGGTIAPDANTTFYQVTKNSGKFLSYDKIADVIATATDAHVFNASWSIDMRASELKSREHIAALIGTQFIDQVITTSLSQDAIFVFAAGNDYDKTDSSALGGLPLVIPELNGHFINVVAWDSETGALATFSNACGPTQNFCITAPGANINVDAATHPINGTSFATPMVSAAVAVIRQAFPYMTSPQITSLLFETARDLGTPGVDATYGHGMLDLERATRPVGTELVPIATGNTIPLRAAHVSGAMAHNIKSADLKLAFVDSYGRAFETRLNDNIRVRNPGRAFARLRGGDTQSFSIGNIEMGFSNTDLLFGDGMLQTDGNKNLVGFMGTKYEFDMGGVHFTTRARIGRASPRAADNSIIESFSDVTVASVGTTAEIDNWTFGVSIPDTVVDGKMTLRLPVARAANGAMIYNDATIDMAATPSVEYSVGYKFMSAGFIDNPYGTDEVYFMARGKFTF